MDRGEDNLPPIFRVNNSFLNIFNSLVTPIIPENDTNNNRASLEFRNNLDEFTVDEELKKQNKQCSICLDEFKIGDKCIVLPCKNGDNHIFHSGDDNCSGIKPWLERNNTCPMCRTEFPIENQSTNETTNETTNIFQTITFHTSLIPPNQNLTESENNQNFNEIPIPNPNNLENNISNLISNYINEIRQNNEQREIQMAIEASLSESSNET